MAPCLLPFALPHGQELDTVLINIYTRIIHNTCYVARVMLVPLRILWIFRLE
jgi:hypothetical protein